MNDLPVVEVLDDLETALTDRGVAVLVAPPGAGKTTLVPAWLADRPWQQGRIVLLEPRRLAARAAARRIAALLGEPVGRRVGYRTRDERVGGRDVQIEVVTEGILVRRLQRDPELTGTGLVILDEVHERNLTTDLSLALTLDTRSGLRPDLRVLAMSATVDAERITTVLGGSDDGGGPAPVVTSAGRQHPVELRWHPPEPRDRPEQHLVRVVAEALRRPDGDLLVFLPGAAEIGRAARALRSAVASNIAVLPLHGSLPVAEQDRALAPSEPGRRRIVLATDIAESSLTVDGVGIVVDAGLARAPRFDPATGLTRLVTEPASRAAADQRAGRAGRQSPGTAHRLWSETDHRRRPAYPVPEIAAVDLAGFALELAVWGATPQELPLVEQPPSGTWAEAVELLQLLGAVDVDGRPTATGRALAELPLHPRLGHVVVAARAAGIGSTGTVLAAMLDGRDVLGGRRDDRPADLLDRLRLVAARGDDRASAEAAIGGVPVDREAVRTIRRRNRDLARRIGLRGEPGLIAVDHVADLVAAAYPGRLAQGRGGGGFRFRDSGGGWLPTTDPLADAPFLAVAAVDAARGTGAGRRGDGRIRLAAPLDHADIERLVGDQVVVDAELRWDEQLDDLRLTRIGRVGALVLHRRDERPEPGAETIAALLHRIRDVGLGLLRWTDGARALRDRFVYAHRIEPDRWPAVDDDRLLTSLDDWLAPHLTAARGRRDLEQIDLAAVFSSLLAWDARQELDRRFPTSVEVGGGGRPLELSYAELERGPVASVRVQRLFGTTEHPSIANGSVPVLLELLSPADRPIQVTGDLPGFWSGTWADVRKEMAGRYPKHDWPVDPATARPPARRNPRRRGRT